MTETTRPVYAIVDGGNNVVHLPEEPDWELHLNPSTDFTSKGWSKKVKAAGGGYSDVRGYATKRYVHLPAGQEELFVALMLRFPIGKKTVVIARGTGTNSLDANRTVYRLSPEPVDGKSVHTRAVETWQAVLARSAQESYRGIQLWTPEAEKAHKRKLARQKIKRRRDNAAYVLRTVAHVLAELPQREAVHYWDALRAVKNEVNGGTEPEEAAQVGRDCFEAGLGRSKEAAGD